jgi:AraC-like DNA-binding protein
MTTKDERERRLAVVEKAIHRLGWSLTLEAALAQQIGVSRRTIRRYRFDVESIVRREIGQERRLLRASLLVRVRGHQQAAREAERFGPLASMLGLEARMTGVLEPEPEPIPDTLEAVSSEDLLAEIARDLSDSDLETLVRLRDKG